VEQKPRGVGGCCQSFCFARNSNLNGVKEVAVNNVVAGGLGTASEPIGDAAFTVALPSPVTAGLFASRTGGTFLLAPVELGRRTASTNYSLLVTDLAGNLAASPSTGWPAGRPGRR
jgi:hypothetical protein